MEDASIVEVTPPKAGFKRSSSEFSLEEEGSVDGSVDSHLSPLARRIPKAKRVLDSKEMRRREENRACLVKLVDWAVKNEDKVVSVWTKLSTGQLADDKPPQGFWSHPPKNIRSIDKHWKANFILGVAGDAISGADIQRLDKEDEQIVSDIFAFCVKMVGTEALPEQFADQELMTLFLKTRHAEVFPGTEFETWCSKFVAKQDKVDWLKAGAYAYTFNNAGKLTKVKHMSGKEVTVPNHMIVDGSFTLQQAAHDTLAEFMNGPVTHQVCKLFDKDDGPNDLLFDRKGKAMKNYLEHAKHAQMELRKATQTSADSSMQLRDLKKEKQVAALKKARERLAAMPDKLKGRVILLKTQASEVGALR